MPPVGPSCAWGGEAPVGAKRLHVELAGEDELLPRRSLSCWFNRPTKKQKVNFLINWSEFAIKNMTALVFAQELDRSHHVFLCDLIRRRRGMFLTAHLLLFDSDLAVDPDGDVVTQRPSTSCSQMSQSRENNAIIAHNGLRLREMLRVCFRGWGEGKPCIWVCACLHAQRFK